MPAFGITAPGFGALEGLDTLVLRDHREKDVVEAALRDAPVRDAVGARLLVHLQEDARDFPPVGPELELGRVPAGLDRRRLRPPTADRSTIKSPRLQESPLSPPPFPLARIRGQ